MSMPKPQSRALSSASWWAMSLAACALSGIGLTDAGYSQPSGSFGFVLVWVSLAVIVAGLAYEAWRDLYDTAKNVAWAAGFVGLFSLFVAARGSTLAAIVLGVCAAVWIFGVGYRAWNQQASSPWPDVLREKVDPVFIHEDGDVQFAGSGVAKVVGGQGCDVEFWAQNCVDGPRTVHVALEAEGKVSQANLAVLAPDNVKVELKPGEVVKVTLRCVAVGRAQSSHNYGWQVVVLGSGGKRVRRRRAPSLKIALLTELISLFSALSNMARGRRVTFVATPGPSDVLAESPSFSVQPMWLP